MAISLHETCQEYFARRLREGWKCISLKGYHAILLSPDGIRRELDLRNDIETLRPDAAGDENAFVIQSPADSFPATDHWNKVDEAVADEDTTFIRNYHATGAWARDLFNVADHSVGSETIRFITVWVRLYVSSANAYFKISIKSGTGGGAPDRVTDGEQQAATGSYANYSEQWSTNPDTENAWTWDEIDKLQIGINAYSTGNASLYCTQVYVEVDDTVSNIEAIAGITLANIEKVCGVAKADIEAIAGVSNV